VNQTAPMIDVREQHKIPLAKALRLCLKGIAHRLFRSLLTLTVIVLAVAFFMTLLAENAFLHAIGGGVSSELARIRAPDQRLAVWCIQPSVNAVKRRLAAASGSDAAIGELSAVSGEPAATVTELSENARRQERILAFFAGLDSGTRAMLVKKVKNRDLFPYLTDEAHWAELATALAHTRSLKLPLPIGELKAAVDGHAEHARAVQAFADRWNAGIAKMQEGVRALTGASDIDGWRAWLETADATRLDQFHALLRERGFADSRERLAELQSGLAAGSVRRDIRRALSDARETWRKTFLEDPALDMKMLSLGRAEVEPLLDRRWSQAQLAGVSDAVGRELRLTELEKLIHDRMANDDAAAHRWISGRQAFLMAISFVVCMVGIANAMLMAITERFREIATMKCLGATDGFILQQFLMEAGIQGLAGGMIGTAIGAMLALLKGAFLFGSYLYEYLPASEMALAGALCIVTGGLLSTLASIYPSWSASRMAPMDAMRVE
jgi:hypothetical protein